jgi:nucleoside-diphosphate-sugar epimerase
MQTVLILGANGRLGQAATQAFAQAGWRVYAQLRRDTPQPAGVTPLLIDIAHTQPLARAAAGAQALVYAINPPYGRWGRHAMPMLQQGLAVAEQLGARFMLPGNVYNYGSTMPALLREDTPEQADTPNGRVRVQMEAALRVATGRGQSAVVIRAGDFFGAGRGSWLDLVIAKGLQQGRLAYPGPLDRAHAWAYLPDLAQAFVAVAALPARPGLERLHFAGHTLTGQELLDALEGVAADLGRRPAAGFALRGMPWALLRVLGPVVPTWREVARMRYLWQRPHALDGARLAARVALPPATPLRVALRQSLLDLGLAATPPALQHV